MATVWVLLLLACLILDVSSLSELTLGAQKDWIEVGRSKHREIQSLGGRATCWQDSFASIEVACQDMTEPLKRKLAVELFKCHVKSSGRALPQVCSTLDAEACLKGLSEGEFGTYSGMFIHVDALCGYLQNQVWQLTVEGIVSSLTHASAEAMQTMSFVQEEVSSLQEEMKGWLEGQKEENDVFMNQLTSARDGLELYIEQTKVEREESKISMDALHWIYETLQTAGQLYQTLQATWYFMLAINISWVLTTVPIFQKARQGLFLVILAEVLLEQAIGNAPPGVLEPYPIDTLELEHRLRLGGVMASFCLLGLAALDYLFQGSSQLLVGGLLLPVSGIVYLIRRRPERRQQKIGYGGYSEEEEEGEGDSFSDDENFYREEDALLSSRRSSLGGMKHKQLQGLAKKYEIRGALNQPVYPAYAVKTTTTCIALSTNLLSLPLPVHPWPANERKDVLIDRLAHVVAEDDLD
ncbi:unnamed protein product [Chrysoparadoxa australica]